MTKLNKIGIIGGSGVYDLNEVEHINSHKVETPFGDPSGEIKELKIDGAVFFMLARHGDGHRISPSDINYRANIYALKKLGVNVLVSISAVGSLKEEFSPGQFVFPDQFIDWTKGLRARSFFEEGMVGHVSVADPIEKSLRAKIFNISKDLDIPCHEGGSYVCIEGPQFSTRAESAIYRSFNASVIGMTNVPEAYLAKEAGMAYATVAMVTDYDCWKEGHCTLEEILGVMKKNYGSAQKLVKELVPKLANEGLEFEPENKFAVVTKPELLGSKHKEILNVLVDKE